MKANKGTRYDYRNQAWIVDGHYIRCNHPKEMNCSCFGRDHAGAPARDTATYTGPTHGDMIKTGETVIVAVRDYRGIPGLASALVITEIGAELAIEKFHLEGMVE